MIPYGFFKHSKAILYILMSPSSLLYSLNCPALPRPVKGPLQVFPFPLHRTHLLLFSLWSSLLSYFTFLVSVVAHFISLNSNRKFLEISRLMILNN